MKSKRDLNVNVEVKRGKRVVVKENADVVGSLAGITHYLSGSRPYSMYLTNVNLKADGSVVGRYMGECPDSLIDEYCFEVNHTSKKIQGSQEEYEGVWVTKEGRRLKTANMVAVKNNANGKKVIVIIEG